MIRWYALSLSNCARQEMAQFTGLTDTQWELLERLLDVRQYVRAEGKLPQIHDMS